MRGNSDPGAQSGCADSHVSGCDTAIALTVTDHGHAETRLCTRVFPCAPRARIGALCNPGKDWEGGVRIASELGWGQDRAAPGGLELITMCIIKESFFFSPLWLLIIYTN